VWSCFSSEPYAQLRGRRLSSCILFGWMVRSSLLGPSHQRLTGAPMFAQAKSVCTGLEMVAQIEEFESQKRDDYTNTVQ
jgi:hypothetical protein